MRWTSSSENLGGLAGQFLKRNLLFIWSSQCGLGNANRLKMVDHATSCLVMKALNLGKLLDKRWVEKREGSSLFAMHTVTTINISELKPLIIFHECQILFTKIALVRYCLNFTQGLSRYFGLDKFSASKTMCTAWAKEHPQIWRAYVREIAC